MSLAAKEAQFTLAKEHSLGKLDKSSAGRIDPHAVGICSAINAADEWFTTSRNYGAVSDTLLARDVGFCYERAAARLATV